ncbi:hypothetical protein [Aerosakkonema funiforme]|uniref:Uncharacterized protein n=1 Tax=Aerosakkonema funiforme FACHB-1375 TaxID=2949571 RepID=A0A926VHS1_9CYAN|nr:hypothetical protein [Aerosakkonema funiforme]MBD2183960.1 hypothetical protein [Aerosakkonema funiforme FACHB-1375]
MTFFNTAIPPLRRKATNIDFRKYPGVWRINIQIGNITLHSSFYTKLDQACILWGAISVAIFVTAQFLPLDWKLQAVLWSVLTVVGTVAMLELSRSWIKEEPFRSIIYCWAILMLGGLIVTDLGVFLNWGEVLIGLCPLWLGLNALGYFYTGLAMRSRTFLFTSLVHLLGIAILPYVGGWQFLTTGLVIGLSVLLLAEFEWDTTASCTGNPANY